VAGHVDPSASQNGEELDEEGKLNLCDALPLTATGVHLHLKNDRACKERPRKILVDGWQCQVRLLSDFTADEVELVEFFGTDMAGSLAGRGCKPPVFVVWRRGSIGRQP
jgi:hypothetical protein